MKIRIFIRLSKILLIRKNEIFILKNFQNIRNVIGISRRIVNVLQKQYSFFDTITETFNKIKKVVLSTVIETFETFPRRYTREDLI